MLKKIFSSIVAVSFLMNTVSYADLSALKSQSDVSTSTLAPESRIASTANSDFADVMKLTATAVKERGSDSVQERASLFTWPATDIARVATPSAPASTIPNKWFPNIKPLQCEGPAGSSNLAFQWFDPNGTMDGVPMPEKFHFSMAWWHTMLNQGADMFGGPTKDRPWLQAKDPMQRARDTVEAAFELMQKLGMKYYAFHDRDIAPEAYKADGTLDVVQTEKNLIAIVDYMKQKQDETGIKLLWGTANLFSSRRQMAGAATNPDLYVILHSAAQVKAALDATVKLGGTGYVLWGGREGYESLLNTCTKKEKDNLAQFLRMVRDYAKEIGFKGRLMIEPKPKEPSGHQYDFDAATTIAFLYEYGLQNDYYLNIEDNHARLAGHTMQHELQMAADSGKFASIDANSGKMPGSPELGWDSDHFPGLSEALEAMLVIDKIGGFTTGGVHFDAKVRRTSTDLEDLFIAHALGMDSYVLAHIS